MSTSHSPFYGKETLGPKCEWNPLPPFRVLRSVLGLSLLQEEFRVKSYPKRDAVGVILFTLSISTCSYYLQVLGTKRAWKQQDVTIKYKHDDQMISGVYKSL